MTKIVIMNDDMKINLDGYNAEVIVYDYTYGYYEGSGTLVAKLNDGRFMYADLGHCSCYGPTEAGREIYADDLDSLVSGIYHDEGSHVVERLRALLNKL